MSPDATTGLEQRRIGRCLLRSRLGRGGMGEVYLAELQGRDGFVKDVALKVMRFDRQNDDRSLARFIDEARLNGHLRHPNIVQTLDWGHDGQDCFLIMEFVEGVSLDRFLDALGARNNPPPLPVALEILRKVTDGLEYAHRCSTREGVPLSIVHRDLKPANVLLGVHGEVKLADFGIARAASALRNSSTSDLVGTLAYMSPEQARGEHLDHRSDLFSLGALFFEVLTLEPLRRDAGVGSLLAIAQGQVNDRLDRLVGLPPELVDLVRRLLAPQPDARPTNVGERLSELALSYPAEPGVLKDLVTAVVMRARAEATQETAPPISLESTLNQPPPPPPEPEDSSEGTGADLAIELSSEQGTGDDSSVADPPPPEPPLPVRHRTWRSVLPGIHALPVNVPTAVVPTVGVLALVALALVFLAPLGWESSTPTGRQPAIPPVDVLAPQGAAPLPSPLETPAKSPQVALDGPRHPATSIPSGEGRPSAPPRSPTVRSKGTGGKSVQVDRRQAREENTGAPGPTHSVVSPPPAPVGALSVHTEPWARVFVDGDPHDDLSTPLQLPAGIHRLKLVTGDGRSADLSVEIRPGQETRVPYRFDQVSDPSELP